MKALDLVNWEFDYSVGVSEIDTQHRELMNLVNDMILHSSGTQTDKLKYFQNIITIVSNYVAIHFDTEEKILIRTSYEKLDEHKKEHETIIKKIKSIRSELGVRDEDSALYDLTITLKEYFMSHILIYDKDAMEFFQAGSKAAADTDFIAGII